jgi:hypothetical protein
MLSAKDATENSAFSGVPSAITSLTLEAIRSALAKMAAEHGRTLPPLLEEVALAHYGLDAADMAVVVATLEDSLGVNPFGSSERPGFSITLAEFVRLYDRALAQQMFIDLEY